ncbi:hypothetical protein D3C71_1545090 [compost metagenome]
MPVAGACEEVGGAAQHVGGENAKLVAVPKLDANPGREGIHAKELIAFFVDVGLLSGLFAAHVKRALVTIGPVAQHVALEAFSA